jgi:hypothetical protein
MNCRPSTTVENIRQIRLFMQNKPNFLHFLLENVDFTKKQTQYKPNSNPIKANFGPISRVNKPNQSQFKANSNPIVAYEKTQKYEKTAVGFHYPMCYDVNIGDGYENA